MIDIKPLGNLLFDSPGTNLKDDPRKCLGHLNAVSDELLVIIIQELEIRDLMNLSMGCKLLYALVNQEEFWKEKCRCFKTLEFHKNWKSTFVKFKTGKSLDSCVKLTVHSDYLFAGIKASTTPLDTLVNSGIDNIQRFSSLSQVDFLKNSKRPFILTKLNNFSDALEKWDLDYLEKEFGLVKFKAEDWILDFKNYMGYCKVVKEEAPLYLFDKGFGETTSLAGDYTVPAIFNDFFAFLRKDRPDYRWLIVGPERSGSSFHKDPNGTSAWNIVIKGSKKWILFPPNITPPGVFPSKDGSEVTSPLTLAEWFINFYPNLETSQCIQGVCTEGELIFVPSGWWHAVMNLETSIAITQNFVNEHNLFKVLDFLKFNPELVSGTCAKDLYQTFISALQVKSPELLKEYQDSKAQSHQSNLFSTQDSFQFSF